MENYILSEEVRMYPTALRGGTDVSVGDSTARQIFDPESRLTTEFNITKLINRLTLNGSFVISNTSDGMELSINGYYFKISTSGINKLKNGADTDKPIYACIRLKDLGKSSTNYILRSLVPFNEDNMNLDVRQGTSEVFNFEGLYFNQDLAVDNVNTFGLKILTNVGGSWVVPESSMFRFDAAHILIDDSLNENPTSLHEVISKDAAGKIKINADNFKGSFEGNLTGDVSAQNITSTSVTSDTLKGKLIGNADSSTDASYASKIGTNTSHPAIGGVNQPTYVNSSGVVTAGMNITISRNEPTPSTPGKDGDIWFQYM